MNKIYFAVEIIELKTQFKVIYRQKKTKTHKNYNI